MTGESKIFALWLVPAFPMREEFDALISEFAQRFDAPVFEPHLTLFVTALDDSLSVEPLTEMEWPGPLELDMAGIEYSEQFTKTLFVQFKADPELKQLGAALARSLGRANDYELNPHLSLLYQHLPELEKAKLAEAIRLPRGRVRFDSMKAIISPAKIASRTDVESWETVWTRQF